jgi:signal transduction histidine kinase
MEQDRNLELQRSRERLEQIADLAMAQLARNLGDWDLGLRELNSLPPSSSLAAKFPVRATLIVVTRDSVRTYPEIPLLFVPNAPRAPLLNPAQFDTVDQLEFREQQYDRAVAALTPLMNQPATRAEALLRIARIHRKANQLEAALGTYTSLEKEGGLNMTGTPYSLLAADAKCRILTELGRRKEAAASAEFIHAGLLAGRWTLSREALEYRWSELDRLGVPAGTPPKSAFDFAVLVSRLYDRWQGAISRDGSLGGRDFHADSSLVVWNATGERLTALVTPPGWLTSTLTLPANSSDVRWKLTVPGAPSGAGHVVTRSLAEAQLPGRLEFSSLSFGTGTSSSRRSLWLTGVALMVLLVLASGYAVHRGISQELRVARLQSDFVAAVSHEFRSPLTTLRTITELLAQNRIPDEVRRQKSYQFLDRETNRLHRLVEDLLDFGRMESGRKQYRLESHDAFQLVRAAVAESSEDATANGFRVETNLGSGPAIVRADEEALRRAVRNLIENAMKYSPECRTVWVDGTVEDHRVSISVRDQGMGIDPQEQRTIFQKFVRGNAAKKAGIKGTGIGLSMVQQISEALKGEVRVQSKVGAGSTFTILLPLAGD